MGHAEPIQKIDMFTKNLSVVHSVYVLHGSDLEHKSFE